MPHHPLDDASALTARRTAPPSYADAITVLAAMLLARYLLMPWLGTRMPFVTVFPAIAFAAWRAGARAGVFVAVTGYVACGYMLSNADLGRMAFVTLGGEAGLAGYVLTSGLIIGFAKAARTCRARERRGRELLNVMLHSVGDGVITTDTALRVTSMNAAAETLTGWTEAGAANRPVDAVFRIIDADLRTPMANPAETAMQDDSVPDVIRRTVLIGKSGSEYDIDYETTLVRDEDGAICACVLVFRDISGQRQVARVLDAQCAGARMLASVLESTNDAVVGTALDGTIQSWNPAAESLFGYTPAEAIGRNMSFLTPFDRPAELESIVARLSSGQHVEHLVTERLRSDFQSVPVALTVSPMRNNEGHVVGALTIARSLQAV